MKKSRIGLSKYASPRDRLIRQVVVDHRGCWIYQGKKEGRKGARYGCIMVGGKHVKAHRLSYSIHVGPIPEGKCVCHRCDVPLCVNPDHLFIGTQLENLSDMDSKRRRAVGVRNGVSKLDDETVLTIRNSESSTRTLAHQLGVSQRTINYVRKGFTWQHVAG